MVHLVNQLSQKLLDRSLIFRIGRNMIAIAGDRPDPSSSIA